MTQVTLERSSEAEAIYAERVVLRGRKPTKALYGFLRSYVDQELEGSISGLANLLGLSYSVVARWLEPDESKRTMPSPEACVLIASKVDENPISIFRMAGYLPERTVMPGRPDWDDDLRDLFRRGKRVARRADTKELWALIRVNIQRDMERWGQLIEDYQQILERHEETASDGPA